jgi:glycosyltransferase involved in cell wall biosynthesis
LFGGSPFQSGIKIQIPETSNIVFVSDLFVEDYAGGAELTTEALIGASPLEVYKLHSKDVTLEILEQGHQKHWIFGNFSGMNVELIPTIVANMSYSLLEYDYKYCRHRSPEKHVVVDRVPCNCHDEMHGKMISAFMYGAKSLWWMSEKQMERYHGHFPFLAERDNVVLSSVFDDRFFLALKFLREKYKEVERKKWVVLGSTSWIKGGKAAEQWCEENGKEYEILWNKPYEEVLQKLAQAEGFVYLPLGGDTCPRMVIEAKLLGCKLEINDNVEHAKELWFETDEHFDTEAYLYAARSRFWNGIKHAMEYSPTVSGYTTTHNCIKHGYPWRQSIQSMLEFCHEVVVVDGGSKDGTWKELEKWAKQEDRLKVHKVKRNWSHPRFAVFDGAQKAEARKLCNSDFCWQQDADEVVHENDYEKIHQLLKTFPAEADLVSLPVVEYWGGPSKMRIDVNPWKWRISRNKPHITHGIPIDLVRTDEDGNFHAAPGTDGCDYVHIDSGERIPHANFYNHDAHKARLVALQGEENALKDYTEWFERSIELIPGVHHYSWFDLERKIKTYRDYWSQHWQSLYNIEQDDTAENNMFFEKPWKEVTAKEIKDLAKQLGDKMGGWVFHERVDFSRPTPYMTPKTPQPAIMMK